MNQPTCEHVRDVYPDVSNGSADAAVVREVHAHLATCAECRAECAVVDAVRAQQIAVPAGLQQRIAQAAARRPRWQVSRARLALAATLAAALIGGGLFLRLDRSEPAAQLTPAQVRASAPGLGAVGVEAAMLSGKSSLDDLSVEQLETLLGEMES